MTKLLIGILTLVWVLGCSGADLEGTEFDDQSPNASTTGMGGASSSTTNGAGGNGGSAGSTSTTTGVAATGSAGGSGGSSGTGGTDGTSTTGDQCAPPTSLPEAAWESYSEEQSDLCPDAAPGTVRCDREPCGLVFKWDYEVESLDGLVLKITYKPQGAQTFNMVHECGEETQRCKYSMNVETDAVYFLELERTAEGFAVKDFYAGGDVPLAPLPVGTAEDTDECRGGDASAESIVRDYWEEYVAVMRGMTWDC